MSVESKPSEGDLPSLAVPEKVGKREGNFQRLSAWSTAGAAAISLFALSMSWDSGKLAALAFWRPPQLSVALSDSLLLAENLGLPAVTQTVTITHRGGPSVNLEQAKLRFLNRDTGERFELDAKAIRLNTAGTGNVIPWRPITPEIGRTITHTVEFVGRSSLADVKERRSLSYRADKENELRRRLSPPSYTSSNSATGWSTPAWGTTEKAVGSGIEALKPREFDAATKNAMHDFRKRLNPFKKGNHDLCLLLYDDTNQLAGWVAYRFLLDDWELQSLDEAFNRVFAESAWSARNVFFWGLLRSSDFSDSDNGQRRAVVSLEISKDAGCLDATSK